MPEAVIRTGSYLEGYRLTTTAGGLQIDTIRADPRSEVPGTLFYNVVRGEMKYLKENDEFFHLGQLTCISSATTQTNILGSEDPELPPIGEAFFYLVEYNDGFSSGYGTESSAKPRFVPPGQGNCP